MWRAGREGAEGASRSRSGQRNHEDGERGFRQSCNAQVAVDRAHRRAVAQEIAANASRRQGGVPALLDAVMETSDKQS